MLDDGSTVRSPIWLAFLISASTTPAVTFEFSSKFTETFVNTLPRLQNKPGFAPNESLWSTSQWMYVFGLVYALFTHCLHHLTQ